MAQKIAGVEYDVRYAADYPRLGRKVPAYVIGMEWSAKGEYVGHLPGRSKPRGKGRAVLAVMGVGDNIEATEAAARSYTDARHVALNAIVNQLGTDSALDSLLFPADGWIAKLLPWEEAAQLVPWDEYAEQAGKEEMARLAKEAEEREKKKTYRKLRTHMLHALQLRNEHVTLGNVVPAPRVIEKVGPVVTKSEVMRAEKRLQRVKDQIAALEPKALELSEVSNYQRAVHKVEEFLVNAAPGRFLAPSGGVIAEDTNLLAHDLLLQLAPLLQDEPRTMSARRQHAEIGRTKEALSERWRKGTDRDGYDWLGDPDQDHMHVIDVIVGLMVDRGWRPMIDAV